MAVAAAAEAEMAAAVEVANLVEPEPEHRPVGRRVLGPMASAEFGTAEVLRWLETVEGLAGPQRAAIRARLEEEEYTGQDLLDWNERNLPKLLRGTGAAEVHRGPGRNQSDGQPCLMHRHSSLCLRVDRWLRCFYSRGTSTWPTARRPLQSPRPCRSQSQRSRRTSTPAQSLGIS